MSREEAYAVSGMDLSKRPRNAVLFHRQKRAGGYTKPIGFYSRQVLDSKNAFSLFGPLREKLGKRLLYPVGSFFP